MNGQEAACGRDTVPSPRALAHLAGILYLAGYVALRLWLWYDSIHNPGHSGEEGVLLFLYTLPLSPGLAHLLPGEAGLILALLLNTALLWLGVYLVARVFAAALAIGRGRQRGA